MGEEHDYEEIKKAPQQITLKEIQKVSQKKEVKLVKEPKVPIHSRSKKAEEAPRDIREIPRWNPPDHED